MYFAVNFDSSVANAPAGFKACVNAACQYYDALFTNTVTVSVNVGWGEVAGQSLGAGGIGASLSNYTTLGYSQVVSALTAQGAPGSSTLPQTAPTAAASTLVVATSEARALGLASSSSTIDGSIGIDSTATWLFDPTQAKALPSNALDVMGTLEHELSEVMGRVSNLDQNEIGILDLFRYAASGTRQLTTGDPSYFSINGGATALGYFNNFQTGDKNGDLADWVESVVTDSYGAGAPGILGPVSSVDKTLMAAMGWTTTAASTALTVAGAVPTLGAAAATSAIANAQDNYVAVSDTGANISAQLDSLETLAKNGNLSAIAVTSGSIGASVAQLSNDADAFSAISGSYSLAVSDTGAHVAAGLSTLATDASSGLLASAAITDAGFSGLSVTAAQFSSDSALFRVLSGNYYVVIDATAATSLTLSGVSGHGAIVTLAGTASQYTVTPTGDGTSFTIASGTVTDHLSGVTALQFGSTQDIVAATPGSNGVVTTGNVTELYGAVFGRLPDVPGLAYYQAELTANPGMALTNFAQSFLASPEYTNNSAHTYAQTTVGDTQFITDLYNNLLHRAPASGDAAWYEANVIAPHLTNLTQGTSAYTAALAVAHAYVVTDFSQSAEFLGNVQITAQHPADSQHWLYLI